MSKKLERRRQTARAAAAAAAAAAFTVAAIMTAGPAPAAAAALYWDANSSAGGGSNSATAVGTWGASNFWNTSPAGTSATAGWVAGSTAVFAAGSNVTGTYSVSVSGTQNAAGLTFEEGTVTLGGSGTIALNGAAEPLITLGAGTDSRIVIVNAALTAAGQVTIARGTSGSGTLTLGGANTFGGGLSVAGSVRVDANSSSALGGAGAGDVIVTGTGALFSSTAGSQTVLASIDVANNFVLNPGGAGGAGGFATAFGSLGHSSGSNRLTFAGDIAGDADVVISAAFPGPGGSVEASGNGLTVFSGINSYAGRTIVNIGAAGTFQLGSAGALPVATELIFGRGQADGQFIGVMDLAGQSISIASLATDAGGTTQRGITNSHAGAGGAITITGAAATTFVGVIGALSTPSMNRFGFSGSSNLRLSLSAGHTGSLTLTGPSTYAGPTTIDGGTLVVAHTATNAPTLAGDVVVNAGGRLASAGGTGAAAMTTIGGAVTVNDGGVLEPGGAAAGELSVGGGLIINSDSASSGGKLVFSIESATSYDRIDLGSAALTLDDGFHPVEIESAPGGAVAAGTYELMTFGSRAFDGVHGFTKTLDPGGGFSYTLDFTDTALRLLVAPLTQTLCWDVGGGGPPIVEGGGAWTDGSTNFSDVAAGAGATFANAGSADVVFGSDAAAAGGTITLGGAVRTGGMLIFGPIDPATPYTIDGGAGGHVLTTVGGITANSSATINAAVALESSQTWQVAAGRTLAVGGDITGAASVTLTKTGAGVLALGGANDIGGLLVDAGVVAITAGATKLGTLTITGEGSVDLRDNKLITSSPIGAFDGTAYSGVQGEVARAYNFGAWDLPGLTTSEERAGPNAGPLSGTTTIGVATGEQILFLGPTDTGVFAGHTVTGASVLAMYTYAGDLNFDGLVDAADYGVIDNFVQFPGSDGYANGDFNYDGVIDAGDYGIIDNTIQLQGPPIPTGGPAAGIGTTTAVPEPAIAAWLALAPAALLPRRCRRRRRRRGESGGTH